MVQPEGFKDGTKRVCKLQKALYGLKQSSRVWNRTLNEALVEFGLKRGSVDQCIYHMVVNSKLIIVAIYVDDVLVITNDVDLENRLKKQLFDRFDIKAVKRRQYWVFGSHETKKMEASHSINRCTLVKF